jgi:hypothetical protein
MRRLRLLAVPPMAVCFVLAGVGLAFAIWSPNFASAGGNSKAQSMPSGNTPTVSAAGSSVTVSWTQSTLATGTAVAGYVVQRYDASTNALQTIGAGCSGTVSALTCTETSVPTGSWKYTVTPKQNSWTGAESAKSGTVTIGAASLSPSSLATGHPTPANPLTTSSVSPTTSVVFVWVKYNKAPNAPTVSSIAGLGCSWSEIANVASSNSNHRLSLWVGTGCSGSGTLSITPSVTPTSNGYAIEEFTHIDTTTPYVSTNVKTSAPATGVTSVSVTPNALASVKNAFYVGVNHTTIEDVSPLNGATEIADDNRNSTDGVETNDQLGWSSGTTGGSWLTSSNNSTLIGVEIRDAPAPTVSSASPSSRGQGAANQNITITGTGFVSGATTAFSGSGITVNSTTFVSSTSLTANITVAGSATTGAGNVTVTNPDAGNGSCAGCFSVNTGPTVSSASPSSRGQGASSQSITITGTGFVSGAAVAFSASGITVNSTTFVSSTSLTANITVAGSATTGAGNVTVTNPDAGNGSCSSCFTVNAAPTITFPTSSSKQTVTNGQTVTFTITGTGFVNGAIVTISGGFTVNSATFTDSTHLSVNVKANSGNPNKGTFDLTVTNPDAGWVTSIGSMVNQ